MDYATNQTRFIACGLNNVTKFYNTGATYSSTVTSTSFNKPNLCCRFATGSNFIAIGTNSNDLAILSYNNGNGNLGVQNIATRSGSINAVDWNNANT